MRPQRGEPTRGERALQDTARGVVSNTVDLVEGARRLVLIAVTNELTVPESFDTIRAFASETDVYPLGSVRDHYSKALLRRMDQQLAEYSAAMRTLVLEACWDILGRKPSGQTHEPTSG